MPPPSRLHLHHVTSQPYRFFGRAAELALLDAALADGATSVVALVGPGGQGKTAILQHWLAGVAADPGRVDGAFLWSFYRGKDGDACLRELYAAVSGRGADDVSAGYCVDRLLPLLRSRRWVVLLDGTEVVQYEGGAWAGRFLHPELGRLLEELGSEPQPGVTLLTTRFALPDLDRQPTARVLSLAGLDPASARGLLAALGVCGTDAELDAAAAAAGRHAKAVELLGTYLVRYHGAAAAGHRRLPDPPRLAGTSDEEHTVTRVLGAFQAALSPEAQDVLALATAFRDPPPQGRLLEYLASAPVRALLHETWGRGYPPFAGRRAGWLAGELQALVDLRLLERVGRGPAGADGGGAVIDAHPLVRRSFDHVLGAAGRRASAGARVGFLRGRPDRNRPASLEEAREDVELFHAYCDAGLWAEADAALAALDRPRYRFLAPAFERDLLLRFFPGGDRNRPPLWPGFRRGRDLAVCLELLGRFEEALDAYPPGDAPLRGDALLALGRLGPLLEETRAPHPWQMLWQSYRAHALALAGRGAEAVALARRLVPGDVYEWTHVFECLLRAGRLDAVDMNSFLYRPPREGESRWNELGRRRMRADFLRVAGGAGAEGLGDEYAALTEEYDRGGLPYERALTRLGHGRWLLAAGRAAEARAVAAAAGEVARRHHMAIMEADALLLEAEAARQADDADGAARPGEAARRLRAETGYAGPVRP